jgi:hypothetical protein
MNIRKSLICALLVVSLPAVADFTHTISMAYELALSDLRVPATPNSGLIFKECASCDMTTVRVTANTQYIINGKSMSLKDFRKAVFQVTKRDRTAVTVLHHLESDTIVSVTVKI